MKAWIAALHACAVFTLGACASPPEFADLKTVSDAAATLTVADTFSYSYPNPAGKTVNMNLVAGTYRLRRENANGRFFEGEQASVWWKVQGGKVTLVRGGLWLPRDAALGPRIYFQVTPIFHGATLDEARAREQPPKPIPAGAGNELVVNTIVNSPTSFSPAQAGVAGGIAGAMVAALGDRPTLLILSAPAGEDGARLRAAVHIAE